MPIRFLLSATLTGAKYYLAAMEDVGVEAVLFRGTETAEGFDGLILCGGGDVDPARYGQELNGTEESSIKPERDENEFNLIRQFIEAGKPILGICRGHQVLNVYFHGTLIQHLPNAPVHMHNLETGADNIHTTYALEDSFIGRLYGTHPTTNTAHHQAADIVGEGLRAVEWADDGNVIEAFEHETLPVYSVQWHPERLMCSFHKPACVDGKKLFLFFIEQCKKGKTAC
ncbi:MAG: type 1 glutamine amidotransferase [Clostridia bacterium]|nr:type 1 glutamine amidotransferase [Clostridia bacterium]